MVHWNLRLRPTFVTTALVVCPVFIFAWCYFFLIAAFPVFLGLAFDLRFLLGWSFTLGTGDDSLSELILTSDNVSKALLITSGQCRSDNLNISYAEWRLTGRQRNSTFGNLFPKLGVYGVSQISSFIGHASKNWSNSSRASLPGIKVRLSSCGVSSLRSSLNDAGARHEFYVSNGSATSLNSPLSAVTFYSFTSFPNWFENTLMSNYSSLLWLDSVEKSRWTVRKLSASKSSLMVVVVVCTSYISLTWF